MDNTLLKKNTLIILLAIIMLISGCGGNEAEDPIESSNVKAQSSVEEADQTHEEKAIIYDNSTFLMDIPEWEGYAFTYVNDNIPDFSKEEIWTSTQESLEPLDDLGRCGAANSCIGQDGMPTEPRGDISSVEPTGWHADKYEFVEGELLFNRCHLIGHQLSGDDAIPRNLITGTSYMNRDGMLQFENAIASYVKDTGNHVMYRVTPIFAGDELLARGVHMEAISVEDDGAGVSFNVFCYNVQPGVDIDYKNGDNKLADDSLMLEDYQAGQFSLIANTSGLTKMQESSASPDTSLNSDNTDNTEEPEEHITTYILNTNTGKFHYPDCRSVKDMKDKNKQEVEATREEIINRGFSPCGNCKP